MSAGTRDTSREAAELIAPRVGTLRERVLRAIAYAPATDLEIQARLGIGANTQRPRRGELVGDGLVTDSGARRRPSGGRAASHIVWRVTTRAERVALWEKRRADRHAKAEVEAVERSALLEQVRGVVASHATRAATSGAVPPDAECLSRLAFLIDRYDRRER